MHQPARTRQERRQDTLRRLEQDVDAWVASSVDGTPYLVPLSFDWDGTTLLIATVLASPTGRGLTGSGAVRVAIGETRDVVVVDGTAAVVSPTEEQADAFAARTGFDPRDLADYAYFLVTPTRIQAWREVNELAGRTLMRDGRWI